MNHIRQLFSAAVLFVAAALCVSAYPRVGSKGGFEVADGTFMLDGKPFVVKAAELHYPRIPKPYWEHRIKMCKALGMNTICLYVFWNFHEESPGEYDFTGQRDIREFIRLCAANDMKVILRPGPYVCAEWEMGGLPWWLLRKEDIRLRELDPEFIKPVDAFMEQVAKQTEGLLDADGGPIIMVQVENEYGSYGKDKPYIATIRDMLRKHFGEDVVLFQCDWSSNFLDNGLDDLLWTMNFGTGADIDSQFAELRKVRPATPLMCSEFWSGWFDKWGASHETRPADDMIAGIDEMLSKGISFSLYMTHGGTNFSHWAGANSPGYAPDVTSYDYDAPINENGAVTPKYDKLRELLRRYAGEGETLNDVPEAIPVVTLLRFDVDSVAPLWSNLPESIADSSIRPMEMYGQGFGSILYSTLIPESAENALLEIDEPRDYAQVFIDGQKVGTLDRRKGERQLTLGNVKKGSRMDMLVEAMGRINFGRAIKDYKGISREVNLIAAGDTSHLENWNVALLPDELQFYRSQNFISTDSVNRNNEGRLPAGVYRSTFSVDSVGDTFLDLSSWGKGLVYVNGHGIGRFWEIGPQQTLYMPGCWLREGNNEIVVFDILGPREASICGVSEPELNSLMPEAKSKEDTAVSLPDLSGKTPFIQGRFSHIAGWQTVKAEQPAKGRYVALEILSSAEGGEEIAVAEIQIIDSDGNQVPRENWRIVAVDSEDVNGGNHTAEKAFDSQESTYWRTATSAALPHLLVIDMGEEREVSALQYLPRMETGAPQSIADFRLYLSPLPFPAK